MPDPDADIPDHLRAFFGLGPDPLTVDERAKKVAEEIRALTRDGYEATDSFPPSSPMGTLLSLSVGATLGTPRFAAEVTHVAPALREFVNAYAAGTTKGSASDAFRALTRLVWLRQPEDGVLIGALAGWIFGLAWLTLCVTVFAWVYREHFAPAAPAEVPVAVSGRQ